MSAASPIKLSKEEKPAAAEPTTAAPTTYKDRITDVQETLPAWGPLEEKGTTWCGAARVAYRLINTNADRLDALTSKDSAVLNQSGKAHAESTVSTTGFSSHRERSDALAAAKQAFENAAIRGLRDQLMQEQLEQSTAVGKALADATQDIAVSVEYQWSKAVFTAGSTGGQDMTSILAFLRMQQSQSIKDPRSIEEMYGAASRQGDDELMQSIEASSEKYLDDLVKGGSPHAAKRGPSGGRATEVVGLQSSEADKMIQSARKLLFLFKQARVQRLPAWLTIAADVYENKVRRLFRDLVGLDPSGKFGGSMTHQEVMQYAAAGGLGFGVDSAWAVRKLPPDFSDGPAGWKPIVGKRADGGPRRAK